jgi:DNA-binding NarL/FixJ family response regulator
MHPPHLLLAEDHADTRKLLRGLLEGEFEVILDVGDGLELVSVAEREVPDVIVTDISMPGMDGIAAATAILRQNPAARIVFVTLHTEETLIERGLAAGALGYVSKLTAGDELVPAVHAALVGERYVSRGLRPRDEK